MQATMQVTMTGKEKYRTYTDDIDWSDVNLNDTERWMSAIGGGALVAYGLSRRNWLGLLFAAAGGVLLYRGMTGQCAVSEGLGISTNASGRRKVSTDHAVKIEKSITINRTPAELYRFWRQFDNLPRFMKHVQAVTIQDDRHSHWTVRSLTGIRVEWDAEIISEIPNELIGWRSMGKSDVENAGSVHFEPTWDGRGTFVKVTLQYAPAGGCIGAALAKTLGEDPARQMEEDLRNLKHMMEETAIDDVKCSAV